MSSSLKGAGAKSSSRHDQAPAHALPHLPALSVTHCIQHTYAHTRPRCKQVKPGDRVQVMGVYKALAGQNNGSTSGAHLRRRLLDGLCFVSLSPCADALCSTHPSSHSAPSPPSPQTQNNTHHRHFPDRGAGQQRAAHREGLGRAAEGLGRRHRAHPRTYVLITIIKGCLDTHGYGWMCGHVCVCVPALPLAFTSHTQPPTPSLPLHCSLPRRERPGDLGPLPGPLHLRARLHQARPHPAGRRGCVAASVPSIEVDTACFFDTTLPSAHTAYSPSTHTHLHSLPSTHTRIQPQQAWRSPWRTGRTCAGTSTCSWSATPPPPSPSSCGTCVYVDLCTFVCMHAHTRRDHLTSSSSFRYIYMCTHTQTPSPPSSKQRGAKHVPPGHLHHRPRLLRRWPDRRRRYVSRPCCSPPSLLPCARLPITHTRLSYSSHTHNPQ